MVGALTFGKKKYAANEPELRCLGEQAEKLRGELLDMIESDGEAFAPLAELYSMPADAPGRAELMEKCLRAAAAPPLRIAELCAEVIELLERYAVLGSRSVLSDAAAAAAVAKGALTGAALTVKVNTVLMRDKEYSVALVERVDALVDEYCRRAMAVCDTVTDTLGFKAVI